MIATTIIIAIIAFAAGAHYQHRRNSTERAMFQAALTSQSAAHTAACERMRTRNRARIDQMRRECEDQLLWAFRTANKANSLLAAERRKTAPAITWPVVVRSYYVAGRGEN